MRVLVTGGAGFLGGYVCEALEARADTPVVFDHSYHGPHYETFFGDIRDATSVTEAVAHVDGVIHLAGVLGTQETITNPLPAAETNMIGGLNVLEACAQYDVPLVNIAVGNWFANNTYAITKHAVERFAAMYATERGVRVNVVRALNAYGPRQSAVPPYGTSRVRKIIPSFVCRALAGEPIEVYGDGLQVMDMIYVADVADVLVAALTEPTTLVPFEAGTGRRTTVLDIAKTVIAEAGGGDIVHLPMRPGEASRSVVVGDPDTLTGLVDPAGFVTLEDGVARTVAWYRQ